jgi:hypothetical protein
MKILNLKFTFMQVDCVSEPLGSRPQPSIPFDFLTSDTRYQQFIGQPPEDGAPKPRLPFSSTKYGRLFWSRYIHKIRPRPLDFWQLAVPLHYDLAAAITVAGLDSAITTGTYLYPWGIGTLIDIVVAGAWNLDEVGQLGLRLAGPGKYILEVKGAKQQLGLNDLLRCLLDLARSDAFGDGWSAQPGELFSIVTVLDGEGANASERPPEGKELHQLMQGMVSWNQNYQDTPPPRLKTRWIDKGPSPRGHVLYGGQRGRFVWFPASFKSKPRHDPTLSCYHQNLSMASLQTESLCRFAKDALDRWVAAGSLVDTSLAYQDCANLVAGLLGRLYGGNKEIYRSGSIRDQIANNWSSTVSDLRQRLGMAPLH